MSQKIMTMQQWLNNFLRSDLAKNYNLNVYDIAVLHGLASYCWYKSKCNPSQSSLKDYCRFSEDEIQKSQTRLESLFLIKMQKQNGKRNNYELFIPRIEDEEIYYSKKSAANSGRSKKEKNIKPAANSGRSDDSGIKKPAAIGGWSRKDNLVENSIIATKPAANSGSHQPPIAVGMQKPAANSGTNMNKSFLN